MLIKMENGADWEMVKAIVRKIRDEGFGALVAKGNKEEFIVVLGSSKDSPNIKDFASMLGVAEVLRPEDPMVYAMKRCVEFMDSDSVLGNGEKGARK